MAEKRVTRQDSNYQFDGNVLFGTTAFTAATDGVNVWTGTNAPVLSIGMSYLTVTCGASQYKIPAWPTA
jgi:hypothetical protein